MVDRDEEMMNAIRQGDAETVQRLCEDDLRFSSSAGFWMKTASERNHVQIVKLLLAQGIDVDVPWTSANPVTPLCAAAKKGALDVASFLLDSGANAQESADGRVQPLVAATQSGSVEMVRMFLKHGANVNGGGGNRVTPLAAAATRGHTEVVRLLLDSGADPNVLYGTMEFGDPPRNSLLQAIDFGHTQTADLLRSYGAKLPQSKEMHDQDAIDQHVRRWLGQPRELVLNEIVTGIPPIKILCVPLERSIVLITVGMSDRSMSTPRGGESYRFAELLIHLPKDWPISEEQLRDPVNSWPVDWLRRIAPKIKLG